MIGLMTNANASQSDCVVVPITTIPQVVRQWLNLEADDHVVFIRRGDEIVLQPLTKTLFDLRGSVPVTEPQDFSAIRQEVLERRAGQIVQRDR